MPSRMITARVGGNASAVAARLPSLSGVVEVPRLHGWGSRPLGDLLSIVRGAVIRAVTARESLISERDSSLRSTLEDHVSGMDQFSRTMNATKNWCVQHRHDPLALQVLCENRQAPIDASLTSMVVEASASFGEMSRSRVFGAIAKRVCEWRQAIDDPGSVLKVLNAAKNLPWESSGHEVIAGAVVALDKDLFYEVKPAVMERFERQLGGPLAEIIMEYASHPRCAVAEIVARTCERGDVLARIADRAQDAMEIDERQGFRLIGALASNRHASADVLSQFARPELWTEGVEESKALQALLARAIGSAPGDHQSRMSEPAQSSSPSL